MPKDSAVIDDFPVTRGGFVEPPASRRIKKGATENEIGITLTVNGREESLSLEPRVTLLDALREHLNLTGTKKGCDHGQCGACTVLVQGVRINSCLTLAAMHD